MKRKVFMEKFHEKLKVLRKKQGLTQKEVADYVGIKQNSYSDWENGKTEPSLRKLLILVDLYSVSLDWLVGRNNLKNNCEEFCKRLSRSEFEDCEKNKTIGIKAMRVVLLALGYDENFVEEEFRKEIEKAIIVKE
jgi:transcriptional regulator, cro/CI family